MLSIPSCSIWDFTTQAPCPSQASKALPATAITSMAGKLQNRGILIHLPEFIWLELKRKGIHSPRPLPDPAFTRKSKNTLPTLLVSTIPMENCVLPRFS